MEHCFNYKSIGSVLPKLYRGLSYILFLKDKCNPLQKLDHMATCSTKTSESALYPLDYHPFVIFDIFKLLNGAPLLRS